MERSEPPRSAIAGVQTIPLTPHPDRRGWLTEVFRDSWLPGPHNLQVNVMWSRANSLRGVHVHGRHADWDDPALGIAWPCSDPLLSDHDRATQSYDDMLRRFEAWRD